MPQGGGVVMTGVWVQAYVPTFARVATDRGVQRWAVVLAAVYLATAAAATAARWKVTAYWTAPSWQERLGPGVDLSLPPYERTVWPHALAITLVVALALAIMVPLLRAGLFTLAVLVGAGAGFGPLRMTAAPVIGDLEFLDSDPTLVQVAWPLAVGAAATVLLLVVAGWLARPAALARPGSPLLVATAGLVCLAVPLLALPMIPDATVDPGHEPGLSFHMVTGWGLLAGGLLAAGLLGASRRPTAGALARLALAGAAPAAMWWAYHRDGGWPGVPGWDHGMASPLFLTVQITAVLIGAAAVGCALAATHLGHRLHLLQPVKRPDTDAEATPATAPAGRAG
jgi:hypothetical protein